MTRKPHARHKKPVLNTRLKKGSAMGAAAIALVSGWEGLKLIAYKDIVGVPTVCFGETRGVSMGDQYSKKECQAMLGNRLMGFETRMRACIRNPDKVPDGLYITSLSLAYNVGSAGYCRSSVNRHTNAGKWIKACNALLLWNKAGGRVVQGLVNRRTAERKLCLKDFKVTPAIAPVPVEVIEEAEPVDKTPDNSAPVAKPKPQPKRPWWKFWG